MENMVSLAVQIIRRSPAQITKEKQKLNKPWDIPYTVYPSSLELGKKKSKKKIKNKANRERKAPLLWDSSQKKEKRTKKKKKPLLCEGEREGGLFWFRRIHPSPSNLRALSLSLLLLLLLLNFINILNEKVKRGKRRH
jgi:hypothetical protein